jgi:hypothetical protein
MMGGRDSGIVAHHRTELRSIVLQPPRRGVRLRGGRDLTRDAVRRHPINGDRCAGEERLLPRQLQPDVLRRQLPTPSIVYDAPPARPQEVVEGTNPG